jgi:hypothetical protein
VEFLLEEERGMGNGKLAEETERTFERMLTGGAERSVGGNLAGGRDVTAQPKGDWRKRTAWRAEC